MEVQIKQFPPLTATRFFFSQTAPERGHKNSNVALSKASPYEGDMVRRASSPTLGVRFILFLYMRHLKEREMLFIYTIYPLFSSFSLSFILSATVPITVRTFTETKKKKP